jgi:hypothetical protein
MKIGYWKGPDEPHLPSPVATNMQIDPVFLQNFQSILDNIRNSYRQLRKFPYTSPFINASLCCYMGYSTCRICQKDNNGDSDVTLIAKDCTYTFPDGLIHYYKEHGVAPDPEFMAFINAFKLTEKSPQHWKAEETLTRLRNFCNLLEGKAGLKYTV